MDTCILCKSSKKDDIQYGEFLKNKDYGVHTFCLYLSSNLAQNGDDDEGFMGFLEVDIKKEVRRISLLKCVYCSKKYANIGCCERKCHRTFHFICGLENDAENQFSHEFRSFCRNHRRKVSQQPSPTETCLICYDILCCQGMKYNKFNMILTPCCRNGWFHKLCLQKFAKTAGYFFKCPLCNDSKIFREKLPAKGIFIPNQDAAWELEPNAFAELLERPNECAARKCKNKKGRKNSSDRNPFVMCRTCGSTAMHLHCLPKGSQRFHCADCTIAMEDGDSGQESFNVNHVNKEDELIDVCHVTDKEDFVVTNRLIDLTNINSNDKEKVAQRDPDSESIMNNSKDDDINHSTNAKNTRPIIDFGKTNDYMEEDIVPKSRKNTRRLTSSSESDEDEVVASLKNIKTVTTLTNSEDDKEDQKIRETYSNNLQQPQSSTEDVIRISRRRKPPVILSDSDSDDDPLVNFSIIMEKRRRLLNSKTATNLSTQLSTDQGSTKTESEKNEENLTNIKRKSINHRNVKQNSHKITCAPLKDEDSSKNDNNLDISCIARRTRRQSLNCSSNNNATKESVLNTSCIAIRTRRRTICAQTNYRPSFQFEQSQIFDKIHESEEEINEDSKIEIVDDSYQEKDNKLEISCIANRTRKRKSLKENLPHLPEDESYNSSTTTSCSSSYNSPDSPTSSGASSCTSSSTANCKNLSFLNIRKRCTQRLFFSYEDDSESPQTSHHVKTALKIKTISPSLLLDKLPQHNYTAFLNTKSSSKSSNHPHSNNRKWF